MPGDEDILFSAAVKDYTEEFFRRYDHNIAQMEQRTNQAMSRMDSGSRKASVAMGLIAGAVGGVSAQLAGMAMRALSAFPNIVKGATALTARVDTLGVALRTVGGNAGYSADELAEFEEAVKNNGITTRAARQTLLQMAQANLDLSKASQIARVAQDAAVIAGINSSEATMRLIHGITTLNPLILRNMGIVISAEKEYQAWAAANGTTTKSLDYTAKQQIMLNAVLKAGTGIAGTYESAMGSVGKQVTSLPRHIEELQLSLGRAFQPAYGEAVQWLTRELKELRAWVEDNQDAIEQFAEALGKFTAIALDALGKLIELLAQVPGAVVNAGNSIADLLQGTDSEVSGEADRLGEYFGKAITLVVGFVAAGTQVVIELVGTVVDAVRTAADTVDALLDRDWDRLQQLGQSNRVAERWEGMGERIRATMESTMVAVGDMFGVIEDVDTSEAVAEVDNVRDATDQLAEALADAAVKLDKLNAKYAKETAAAALKQTRQEIDDAINTARRYEDLQRSHQRRLDAIYKNAAKSRQRLTEDLSKQEAEAAEDAAREREKLEQSKAEKLLDVEVEYRRRLEDIQSDWQYQSAELARKNDAVGLLRLMRAKKRQLEEAKKTRDRDREDANTSYTRDKQELERSLAEKREQLRKDAQERLAQLDANLREQLASAEEARQRDLENLQRSLQRSREDKERHRAWDAEDRARKHAQELEELGRHFASMEGLTKEGLEKLLEEHASAITDLETLWKAYYETQEQMAKQANESASLGFIGGGRRPPAPTATGSHGFIGGYQTGGMGIARKPSTIMIGEKGPEAFAVLPMQSLVTHKFSDLNINLQGVTPENEAQLLPVIYDAFVQLAQAVAGA